MPPEAAVVEHEAPNLPAERPQHPIIAKIDAKMPEIAQMLPEGMSADRFRRVVVQALVRNPDLWACTPVSVVSAIVEAAQIGLEPTGVLGRAWMLPYTVKGTKEAKLIVGYRGYAELAWRADRILVTTGAVRTGDHFEYRRGTGKYLHHVPASDDPERESDDSNITDFWAMYTLPDGREDFDVMSRKGAERIRDKARYRNPVWDSDFGEMGRKTVLRRLLKVAPLSPAVQRVLARDEEIDYDTPVERVADPKRDDLRDRIAARTAALRGESTEESEAGGPSASGATPAAASSQGAPAGGSSARGGDPWMRRLHAVASERGMDHAGLHDWSVEHFGVDSLSDLTIHQRATFMELVERMEVMPPSAPREADDGAVEGSDSTAPSDTPEPELSHAPVTATPAAASSPPGGAPSAAPTDEQILAAAGDGAEIILPEPGTDAYKTLSAPEKAAARAWHQKHTQEPDTPAEQMRAALEGE